MQKSDHSVQCPLEEADLPVHSTFLIDFAAALELLWKLLVLAGSAAATEAYVS